MPFASLTSGRGNRVIIDDPHSTEQVESDADRERAERIFRESVTSRLNDPQRDPSSSSCTDCTRTISAG
jgi:hypothetical protein